jgi:hypothetical protein
VKFHRGFFLTLGNQIENVMTFIFRICATVNNIRITLNVLISTSNNLTDAGDYIFRGYVIGQTTLELIDF